MKNWALASLNILFLGSALLPAVPAQDSGRTPQDVAFRDAILAAEKRDYALLRSIIKKNPSVLNYRAETGDDLFHEFQYVFHEDSDAALGNSTVLEAIETLLDMGAIPSANNGLLGTLLTSANEFGGEVEAFPINSGQCTENRQAFFPVIDRLIEAGAEFGFLAIEVSGLKPSEAFFYQYQLCFSPFICGGSYERPSETVKRRVSTSTTQVERDFLFELAAVGSQDLDCLMALNDW